MAKADKNYSMSPENLLAMTFTKPYIWFKRAVARNLCSHNPKKLLSKCLMFGNRLSENVILGRYDAICFS